MQVRLNNSKKIKTSRSVNWANKKILITGGASFIGSHLVDAMVPKGGYIRVADDFSSGKKSNIQKHLKEKNIELVEGDLRDTQVAKKALKGIDVVFHLACDHGGRGYVELHQADCATNLALDGTVFLTAKNAGVEKIVYASSGCVYPNFLQMNTKEQLFLAEDLVGPPYHADNMYGWSKLMGEMTLKAYHADWRIKTASCRFFTVYGKRGLENHAVMAMIARAFLRQDPFIIWGDGSQVRNWTHVTDIVEGMILVAEKIDDGSAINLGTMERIQVMEAAEEILKYTGHQATIKTHPEMPVGPVNRVADNTRAKDILGWEPKVRFIDGLHETIDWYFSTKNRKDVERMLPALLMGR